MGVLEEVGTGFVDEMVRQALSRALGVVSSQFVIIAVYTSRSEFGAESSAGLHSL